MALLSLGLILAGYRLELNPKELGYHVTAFVRVRPLSGHLHKVAELAQAIPEVTECHRVTGEDWRDEGIVEA